MGALHDQIKINEVDFDTFFAYLRVFPNKNCYAFHDALILCQK